MFKRFTRQRILLVSIIILSSLLIISASGSFFYRNAVLDYETKKALLLKSNLTYEYIINSMEEYSKKYIQTGNQYNKEKYFDLSNFYRSESNKNNFNKSLLDSNYSAWILEEFHRNELNNTFIVEALDFSENELSQYGLFLKTFNNMVNHLDASVSSRDLNAFEDSSYNRNRILFNSYMISLTNSYLDRIDNFSKEAIFFQNTFGLISLFLSLALGSLGSFVAYFTIIANKNNSYYRQLFWATVEKSDFGLAIFNTDYQYKYMNNQYREILNISDKRPLGKTPLSLLPEEVYNVINQALQVENSLINSTVAISGTSATKHINISQFQIRDENGQTNYVSTVRDFTDATNMELQLKDQLSEIEFHSKAKDTFIANISHEIKTPLNAIIGLSYVLNDTELSLKQKSIVKRIATSSNLLLSLINDVLDLSKIKNSDFNFYPSNILLCNLLSEVEGIATALIGEKDILWKTEYRCSQDLCINVDKTRLTQVLLNLINNACKFTSEGYIKLLVECLHPNNDKCILKFSIADTGLGMDQDEVGRLFREFEQLENSLTKQHQGTGLGLVISKNIIESMGGTIWVESEKDKGSEFIFTIPVQIASYENFVNSCSFSNGQKLNGQGKKVLVVEDNEINFEVTESLLSKANIICENARDGKEALEMCKNAAEDYYQLILMDIHMPVMDGYTASKILKNEMLIKTPIIALTATNVDGEDLNNYSGIIEGYIPKPFSYEELFEKISPYLDLNFNSTNLSTSFCGNSSSQDPFSGKAKAIENLGGLESLYEKHLHRFINNYYEIDSSIKQLLDIGDIKEAHRLVHSVKGLAGTLGLTYLQNASAEFEEGILNNSNNLDDMLYKFSLKLADVCKGK